MVSVGNQMRHVPIPPSCIKNFDDKSWHVNVIGLYFMFLLKSPNSMRCVASPAPRSNDPKQLIFFNKDGWSALVIRCNADPIPLSCLKFFNNKPRHVNVILSNQLNQRIAFYVPI